MREWQERSLADVCEDISYGYTASASDDPSLPRFLRITDIVPNAIDWRTVPGCDISPKDLAKHALRLGDIVIARTGATVGYAKRIRKEVEAVAASYLVRFRPMQGVDAGFIGHVVESAAYKDFVQRHAGGSAQPNANAKVLGSYIFRLPGLPTQQRICHVLDSIDDLIENNRRRIEVLEEMAQAIYREWFVHFRFPGHEHATFVDSPLGPIPEGWDAMPVASLAADERNAVTGGPFGSKLGRKDYVPSGVPIIRGQNLRIGGGFDESDFVFISEDKASELQSSSTRPGDVLITQRGTLGQVGLIPGNAQFDRYILSQSQMKITVDTEITTPEFVYAQFCTPSTTERFIAQAMSSGVPHVNLTLLREFELLIPPLGLQRDFTDIAREFNRQAHLLRSQTKALAGIRDLLLPRLVTGAIDVSGLDLDALVGTAS